MGVATNSKNIVIVILNIFNIIENLLVLLELVREGLLAQFGVASYSLH